MQVIIGPSVTVVHQDVMKAFDHLSSHPGTMVKCLGWPPELAVSVWKSRDNRWHLTKKVFRSGETFMTLRPVGDFVRPGLTFLTEELQVIFMWRETYFEKYVVPSGLCTYDNEVPEWTVVPLFQELDQ